MWEVDPLICPLCFSPMRVISVIDEDDVIEKILVHLNLWEDYYNNKAPPEDKDKITYEPIEEGQAVNF